MNDFCVEMRIACEGEKTEVWLIFVYGSTDYKERQEQWNFLNARKQMWGKNWVLGGEFNDIRSKEEKQGGKERHESSFLPFRSFIAEMDMGEIKYTGNTYTWANNRMGEGFIQERLDRFFGSSDWMLQNDVT